MESRIFRLLNPRFQCLSSTHGGMSKLNATIEPSDIEGEKQAKTFHCETCRLEKSERLVSRTPQTQMEKAGDTGARSIELPDIPGIQTLIPETPDDYIHHQVMKSRFHKEVIASCTEPEATNAGCFEPGSWMSFTLCQRSALAV
jgi:hypothetical protein